MTPAEREKIKYIKEFLPKQKYITYRINIFKKGHIYNYFQKVGIHINFLGKNKKDRRYFFLCDFSKYSGFKEDIENYYKPYLEKAEDYEKTINEQRRLAKLIKLTATLQPKKVNKL